MKEGMEMINLQQLPTSDTDDIARSEEERVRRKDDRQVPPDQEPYITPVSDPPYDKDKKPITENQNEPTRLMRKWTSVERRIF